MAPLGSVWLVLLQRRRKTFGTPQKWRFAQHCRKTEGPCIVPFRHLILCYVTFTSINYLKKIQAEGGWGGKRAGSGPNQRTSGIPLADGMHPGERLSG